MNTSKQKTIQVEPAPRVSERRLHALDGLRGLAALVVLVHHAILASVPKMAALYNGYSPASIGVARGSLDWWIFYTPLHIFWAGPEFVAVFFVLSGFVLALPVIRGGRLRRAKYYPSRLLRLYVPVWGALVLAAVLHIIVSHQVIPSASPWLNVHSAPLTWHALVQDMLLGPHVGDWGFNTVLWSLYWIVLFSLLLPVLLIVPFASRIARMVVAALCFYVLYHGTSAYSLYLPPFVLGVVLAFERDAIERLAARLRGRGVMSLTTKFGLGAACIPLLTVDRWISYTRTTLTLVVVGACLSVICALVIPSVRRWFETHPMQWVGRRAYSLYLVHEPLLVAIAFALGATLAPLPFVILVAIAALLVCAFFFRWIEVPSHRLARSVGAWCDQNLWSHPLPGEPPPI